MWRKFCRSHNLVRGQDDNLRDLSACTWCSALGMYEVNIESVISSDSKRIAARLSGYWRCPNWLGLVAVIRLCSLLLGLSRALTLLGLRMFKYFNS